MHTDPPLRVNIGPRFEEIHPRLSLPPSCLPHRHPPFLRVVPCCVDPRVPRGFLRSPVKRGPNKGLSQILSPRRRRREREVGAEGYEGGPSPLRVRAETPRAARAASEERPDAPRNRAAASSYELDADLRACVHAARRR